MEELAEVYARSLFEVALEHDKLDQLREELAQLVDALSAERELTIFFFSPYFSTAEKIAGLQRAVSGADPLLMNFLTLLIENHRMPVIFRVRRRYEALWERQRRQLPVEVTSAVDLDERLLAAIGERVGTQTGRTVKLTSRIDPAIVGGIVVRVGNTILDASIHGRLQNLRRQVVGA